MSQSQRIKVADRNERHSHYVNENIFYSILLGLGTKKLYVICKTESYSIYFHSFNRNNKGILLN